MGSSAKFRIPDPIGASVIPDGAAARREWNQKALTEKRTAVLLADERYREDTLRHLRAKRDSPRVRANASEAASVEGLIAHNEACLAETQRRLGRTA